MRILVLIFLISFFSESWLLSQIAGHGTQSDPYRGSTNGDFICNESYPGNIVYLGAPTLRDLTINLGHTFTLPSGLTISMISTQSDLTINGTLLISAGSAVSANRIANNGTIRMNSGANGISSLIVQPYSYSGNGSVLFQYYLTGGTTAGLYNWHYVSVPVDGPGVTADVFTTDPANEDFTQYVEPLVISEDNSTGWIGSDGYVYATGGFNLAYSFSTLNLGQGYNYYYSGTTTRTVSGALNNSDVFMTLTCGTGFPDHQGFNLVGNPFSSCLDWDIAYLELDETIDDAIYFTINGGVASYVGGVPVGGATNTIPPGQGFFVKANTNNAVLPLLLNARTHNIEQIRYKSASADRKSTDTISFVRLMLKDVTDSSDLVVRFNNKATSGVDKKFDAYLFRKDGKINTWTKTSDTDFSINGLPFPETSVIIPVGINVTSSGSHRFYAKELSKLDKYSFILKDLLTNQTVDLKKGEVLSFDSPAGIIENRFLLTVSNLTTTVSDVILPVKKFSVYYTPGSLNIRSLTDEFSSVKGSVNIYDLAGRRVLGENNILWSEGENKQFFMESFKDGIYLVEISAGPNRIVEKIVLNK